MKKYLAGICCACLIVAGCQARSESSAEFNAPDFFTRLTAIESVYKATANDYFHLVKNLGQCMYYFQREMNVGFYYGFSSSNGYDVYSEDSEYAERIRELVNVSDSMMDLFSGSGFNDLIKKGGKSPALMFDIDNTIEFTADRDQEFIGNGPSITGMVNFVQRRCFRDGIECYFITARYCNQPSAQSTKVWIKNTFEMSDAQVEKYVYLMGTINSCDSDPFIKIAYKDAVREALAKRDSLLWLMSFGDQPTDNQGPNSGLKMIVPNMLFDNSITSNQYYVDEPGSIVACTSRIIASPSAECRAKLNDEKFLEKITVPFCLACQGPSDCY